MPDNPRLKLNSLGINKPPAQTRVIVAMSGGVDSSVTAAMLNDQGYEVIGLTMQLYDHGAAVNRKGACCAGRDIHDAKRIAAELDFPHYVLDYESFFKRQVINEFVDSYTNGYTPIPCIRCNERVKFKELLQTAKNLGADCLATGHYIKRLMGCDGPELHRAADLGKDQSYFLFTTTKEQLEYLRFPLGEIASKEETRKLALRYGLSIAQKPDSQDICFVPEGNYAELVRKYNPDALQPGYVVDMKDNILATHEGVSNFTIGQRRRLGVNHSTEPLYVVRLDSKNRRVVVGPRSALDTFKFTINNVNWLGDHAFDTREAWELDVKVRSTSKTIPAFVLPLPNKEALIELAEPEKAIAPGQACVFYASTGSRVLGGGWISRKAEHPVH